MIHSLMLRSACIASCSIFTVLNIEKRPRAAPIWKRFYLKYLCDGIYY